MPLYNADVVVSNPVSVSGGIIDASGSAVSVTNFPGGASSSAVVTSVSVTTSSTQILAVNSARKQAIIVNDSSDTLFVKFGTAASSISYSYKVPPQATLEVNQWTGIITGVKETNTSNALVTELS